MIFRTQLMASAILFAADAAAAQAPTTGRNELLSKISVKTVGADPSLAKGLAEGVKLPLMKVYGIAKKLVVKKDADGNLSTGLKGSFQAINIQDKSPNFGTIFDAGVAYLPSGIQDMIESAVEGDDGSEENATQFALEIYAVRANNKIGYTYGAQYISDPQGADPMEAMRREALSKGTQIAGLSSAPALAPPAGDAAKVEAPAGDVKEPAKA